MGRTDGGLSEMGLTTTRDGRKPQRQRQHQYMEFR
ncbi:hypothetical protein SAMN04489764_5301 [Thermostaphylospora chromogena]|uniref:Uncharacterized protein n=1 Tax=Thermostaphylospora chromogena TaxID=35622 RepID=A0A1H1I787_9ACTN|nr:hypothetical protein SAMN04489764_5301 [Thermostaphylospora chromogena]